MKKLQSKLTFRRPDQSGPTTKADGNVDDETGNDFDEEEVKQELESRMAFVSTSIRPRDKNLSDDNLVLLDMNMPEICFKISDFPDGMEPGYYYYLVS